MSQPNRPAKKLRSACDPCYQAKTRCWGGLPCRGCIDSGSYCIYSVSNRLGRPKGVRNRRTLEQQAIAERQAREAAQELSPSNHLDPSTLLDASSSLASCNFWDSMVANMGSDLDQSNQLFPAKDVFTTSSDQPNFTITDHMNYASSTTSPDAVAAFLNDGGFAQNVPLFTTPPDLEQNTTSKDFAAHKSTVKKSPNSLSPPSGGTNICRCLLHHAELLCQLKDVGAEHASPPIDAVLISTHRAIHHWNLLLNCSVCHVTQDQEVLVLSAMSVRAVLRRLAIVVSEYVSQISSFSPDDSARKQQKQSEKRKDLGVRLLVGTYEVTDEEQTLVIDLLLMHLIRKIRHTLTIMKEKIERAIRFERPALSLDSAGSTEIMEQDLLEDGSRYRQDDNGRDTNHVQELLVEFEGTLQRLDRTLTSSSRVIVLNYGNGDAESSV